MKIDTVNVELVTARGLTMFVLRVGSGRELALSIQTVLDPKCREFDTTLISDALREMANKLEDLS